MSRRKKRGDKSFRILLALCIAVGLVIIAKQEYSIYQIKKEQVAAQARIDVLKEKKAALESERKKLDDPRYIEKLAREDYNMVGRNEVPIFIVNDKK